jgi:1,3-beta-glucanosyltransferase GAS1
MQASTQCTWDPVLIILNKPTPIFSIDLSLPVNGSIDRASPSWSTNLLDLYIDTIDTFSKYDNVLAFNVGNEVAIADNSTDAATFVKAAVRDIKAYL